MASKPSITRKFEKPFILTATKLSKINEIIEKRFNLIKGEEEIQKTYILTLDKGKKHQFNKIESVLELDNSLSNKIIELSIEVEIGKDEDETRNAIFLNYDSDVSAMLNTSILLAGKADDPTWLNETIAEIEEQVERTIPSNLIYRLKTLPFSSGLLLIAAILLIAVYALIPLKPNPGLSSLDRDSLVEMKNSVKTTEDKINFIYTVLSCSVEHRAENHPIKIYKKPSTYFLITPFIIIIFTFCYLYYSCYPSYVFEWGDFGQHHQTIIEKRKYLWSIIIGSLIIGILANLFVFGLSETIVSKNQLN